MTEVRNKQTFCGEVIFNWSEWEDIDTGALQFYNVNFPFESMKKYNGTDVFYTLEGQLKIYNENYEAVWSGWIMDIPELREKLLKKKKKWHYVETDGNPKEPGEYWVTLIHPEWKDGKKTGKEVAETASRYFADLEEDPQCKDWIMHDQPDTGLAWTEETGSTLGERVYAWMPMEDIDIAELPDGIEREVYE